MKVCCVCERDRKVTAVLSGIVSSIIILIEVLG